MIGEAAYERARQKGVGVFNVLLPATSHLSP